MRLAPGSVTLGVLAGGRASRLGGLDKAWLHCRGQPQVLRLVRRFSACCGQVSISANRKPERYAAHGLKVMPDRHPDLGPIGGLDALAAGCTTPWLFTLPVDALECDGRLLDALAMAGGQGACAQDDDGLQPLFALYRLPELRVAVANAIATGQHSVRGLHEAMDLPIVRFAGERFGNLNTPEALVAAGCEPGGASDA